MPRVMTFSEQIGWMISQAYDRRPSWIEGLEICHRACNTLGEPLIRRDKACVKYLKRARKVFVPPPLKI